MGETVKDLTAGTAGGACQVINKTYLEEEA